MRTEEDKLLKSEITITIGGKEYHIKPLVIREAREWRRKFAQLIGRLPELASITTEDTDGFQNAANAMLVGNPDQMIELFVDYSKLDKDFIEENATEVELADAIDKIMEVAFPLVSSLTGAVKNLGR